MKITSTIVDTGVISNLPLNVELSLFTVGRIYVSEHLQARLDRCAASPFCEFSSSAILTIALSLHSQLKCGCGSVACTTHQYGHFQRGGTITTSWHIGALENQPVEAATLDDVLWIQTSCDRSSTTAALASDMPWDDPDPLEEVHDPAARERRREARRRVLN